MLEMGCEGVRGVRWLDVLFMVGMNWSSRVLALVRWSGQL